MAGVRGKGATGFRQSRWFTLLWAAPIAVIVLGLVVLLANVIRYSPAGQSFLAAYPGRATLPESTPVGVPRVAPVAARNQCAVHRADRTHRLGHPYRDPTEGRLLHP